MAGWLLHGIEMGTLACRLHDDLCPPSPQETRLYLPRRLMPEQCAPTVVFLIHTTEPPHPAAPPPTPWCDYVVSGPEVFDRLSEWQLRTCQLHAQAFPAVLRTYLDRCSRLAGDFPVPLVLHGSSMAVGDVGDVLPPLAHAMRVATLLQAAEDPAVEDSSSEDAPMTPTSVAPSNLAPEGTDSESSGAPCVSPTSPGW